MPGFFGDDWEDPRSAAVMALAGGMLQGNLGAGFLGANDAYARARAMKRQEDLARLQAQVAQQGLEKGGLELTQMRQTIDRSNRIRDELARQQTGAMAAAPAAAPAGAQFTTPEVDGIPMFSAGTSVAASPPPSAAPAQPQRGPGNARSQLSDMLIGQANVYARNGDFEGANKLYEHAAKFMPEVHKIEVAMQGNQPVNVITFKDGTQQVSAFGAPPKVHWRDNGSRIDPVNEYTGQVLSGSVGKTMTPGEVASNAVSWANVKLGRDRLNMESQGVTYQPDASGNLVALPTKAAPGSVVRGTQVVAPGPGMTPLQGKPNEGVQKQLNGITALGGAVDEYVKEISDFGPMDLLRPDRRASMGTKYNNMMLLAKEAYNLGVLNGPDFQILQQVVTNPLSTRGAITSNEALTTQATELKRIMGNLRAAIRGGQPPAAAAAPSGQLGSGSYLPPISDIEAELARRRGTQ